MLKRKYIINLEEANPDALDPNICKALHDVRMMKLLHENNFDFEITGLFDGFMVDSYFDACLNTLLNDIMDESSLFHSIYQKEIRLVEKVTGFIKNLLIYRTKICKEAGDTSHDMDAFIKTQIDGKTVNFSVRFSLPETIITKEKYENFLALGPDYLLGQLTADEIFDYLLAPLYYELAKADALNIAELKNLGRYEIGLH